MTGRICCVSGREKPKGSPPQPPIKVGGSPSGVLFNLGSFTQRAWTVGNAATDMATDMATGPMVHAYFFAYIHTYVRCGRYIYICQHQMSSARWLHATGNSIEVLHTAAVTVEGTVGGTVVGTGVHAPEGARERKRQQRA